MIAIVQELYELPKFDKQKEYCDKIVGQLNDAQLLALFKTTVNNWTSFKFDRQDKFFYLIKKIQERIPVPFAELGSELRNFCLKNYLDKYGVTLEILEFVQICKHKSTLEVIKNGFCSNEVKQVAYEMAKRYECNKEVYLSLYRKVD